MNVYDFDNTILRGDSTARFFAWCLLRAPRMWLDAPGQIWNAVLFLLKKRKSRRSRSACSPFFPAWTWTGAWALLGEKPCPRQAVLPEKHREDDVVISASPEFLIRPACAQLGIRHVLGSPVDKYTGRFSGPNCHGAEKVRRFYAAFPGGKIDEFYSDSYSDQPLADLATRAFLVRGEAVLAWDAKKRR